MGKKFKKKYLMGNILQRYCASDVGICQLRLYYDWFWLAITLHADQN